MNLHHLRSFALVVRLGGLGKAARAAGVSQPALSRALRELERSVGIELLERGPRGLRPTTFGRELFEHAQTIAVAEHDAERLIHAAAGTHRGEVLLGASTTIAAYVLPPIVRAFAAEFPQVDVRLVAAHTRVLEEQLRRYEVDVALVEAAPLDSQLEATPWTVDEMVIIAAPDHPLASRSRLPAEALAGERFVLREPESGTRDIVLRGLADAGVFPRDPLGVDGTEVIKQLVAVGVGIGVVSRVAIVDQLACGRLCLLDVPSVRVVRPFTQLTLRGRKMRPDVAALVSAVRRATHTPTRRGARGSRGVPRI